MSENNKHHYSDAVILHVSLDNHAVTREQLDPVMYREYLGGRGLGTKLLYDRLSVGVDALSPSNLLIFAVGPSTATLVPTSGRTEVITKSPATGTIFDSNVGGFLAPQIRRAGYAATVIEGRSPQPVYIWIDNDSVEIRDASGVWGKDVDATTDTLLKETNDRAQVACIGPAGENLVLLSSIMTDKHRAAGRGGVGAVMGSKNLKALVVRGTKEVAVHDRDHLKTLVEHARRLIKKNAVTNKSLPVYGTAVLVNVINELGMLPTHNFQEGTFNDADGVSGEKLLERFVERTYNCYGCPIGCGRITKVGSREIGGPEYETVWSLGPQCGINDLEWITLANDRCNLLGMDTISVGSTIGCAMELVQRGKLDAALRFGETEGLLEIIEDMAYSRGLGAELAEGSKRLSERYDSPELSMQVKGLEIPAYDPRGVQGHALGYATSNRGGCHLRSYLIAPEVLGSPVLLDRDRTEGKAELVKLFQDVSAAMDSMVVCRFTNFAWTVDDYADMLAACTGFELSGKELLTIGERIYNLERMFNVTEGFSSADDTLPPRFRNPLPEGGSRNRVVHLDEMLTKYYSIRGWDEHGGPTEKTLKRLNIPMKRGK
ncbi:MAG: aldehyde ferredoxin oxidoreductase family protein [Candidatus Thorarchaeota archaeon]|nr:MAG: aldehyde ferredoxin oxidoreductase [Candidatus Thorarchaeota archaeon]